MTKHFSRTYYSRCNSTNKPKLPNSAYFSCGKSFCDDTITTLTILALDKARRLLGCYHPSLWPATTTRTQDVPLLYVVGFRRFFASCLFQSDAVCFQDAVDD